LAGLNSALYAKIKVAIFRMKIMQSTTESLMEKVTTTLAIQNLIDQADAERGMIPVEQIRSVILENVWLFLT